MVGTYVLVFKLFEPAAYKEDLEGNLGTGSDESDGDP